MRHNIRNDLIQLKGIIAYKLKLKFELVLTYIQRILCSSITFKKLPSLSRTLKMHYQFCLKVDAACRLYAERFLGFVTQNT